MISWFKKILIFLFQLSFIPFRHSIIHSLPPFSKEDAFSQILEENKQYIFKETYHPQAPLLLFVQEWTLLVSRVAWQPLCTPTEYLNPNSLRSCLPGSRMVVSPHQLVMATIPQTWLFLLLVPEEVQESYTIVKGELG